MATVKKRGRKFQIKTAANGQPYILLVGSNGRVMFTSETYNSNQAIQATLQSLLGVKLPTRVEELRDAGEISKMNER